MGSTAVIEAVRSATKEDVVRALGPAMRVDTSPKKLRESHHRILRMLAAGKSRQEVSALTGMTPERITQIQNSPAGQHVIARHREALDQEMYAEVTDLAQYRASRRQQFMDTYEEWVLDRTFELLDAGEPLPREFGAIYSDMQDRFGTPKRSANLSIKVGADLEAAIARSERVIEHEE